MSDLLVEVGLWLRRLQLPAEGAEQGVFIDSMVVNLLATVSASIRNVVRGGE